MSEAQINEAIAEACGYRKRDVKWFGSNWKAGEAWFLTDANGNTISRGIPNYYGDLNAIHEAEKIFHGMDYQFKNKYAGTLASILEAEVLKSDPNCIPDVVGFEWIHATAPQRCEAFLKAIGKWSET
jgi:hypothetical protein